MKSFSGLKSGDIICRDSYGNLKYYFTVFGTGAFTLMWICAIVYMLLNPPNVNFFKFDFKTISFFLIPVFLLWYIYSIGNECRFEYYVVYYDDFLAFCFIDKPLFKRSEISHYQLHFKSVLNFQAHGQNRNEIRFNYIEKNGNQTFVFPFSDIHEALPRFFQGWRLVKDYKSHASEIVDFLNHRVQVSKIS